MNACPCCSNPMLRHTRHHETYWFCRSCWQEMPLFNEKSCWTPVSLESELNLLTRNHALVIAHHY